MVNPYKARVDERHFLNLPGFHAGASVVAYVEDTSEREPVFDRTWERNPQPRMILDISDCSNRISLEFEIDDALARKNSFHKIDTLIAALQEFREGMAAECALVKARDKVIRAHDEEKKAAEEKKQAAGRRVRRPAAV